MRLGTWQRQKPPPNSQPGLMWVLLRVIWQVLEKTIVLGLPASSLKKDISQVTKKCVSHPKETRPSPVTPLPPTTFPTFLQCTCPLTLHFAAGRGAGGQSVDATHIFLQMKGDPHREKSSTSGHLAKWINKMGYIQTVEYFSALKRKETQTHTPTWVNLEDIMLREVSQSHTGKYGLFSLMRGIRAVKFEPGSRTVVARSWRWDTYCLVGAKFQFGKIDQ